MEAMTRRALYIIVLLVVAATACRQSLVGESPENTFEENFNSLWRGFDANYSYFEHKGINWDSLYVVYEEKLDSVRAGYQLFDLMSSLLEELEDGHATLTAPYNTYRYTGWRETNFQTDRVFKYLTNIELLTTNSPFMYAETVGGFSYLRIKKFSGNKSDFAIIDDILMEFNDRNSEGLIIDLRTNGGGSDVNAQYVAARFADQKRLVRKIRYRNGPEHSDFSPVIEDYITPGGFYYEKPVALLTDASVFSAAEDFVLAMRQYPNVYVVGVRTGGGSGNPVTLNLPNGWIYTVSRWQILQPENDQLYEGIGLAPDTLAIQTPTHDALSRDAHLEVAVSLLRQL